ncbi:MAG: hypothetical protein Fur003_4340 [Candidatus Dojkabacteria bacterium]
MTIVKMFQIAEANPSSLETWTYEPFICDELPNGFSIMAKESLHASIRVRSEVTMLEDRETLIVTLDFNNGNLPEEDHASYIQFCPDGDLIVSNVPKGVLIHFNRAVRLETMSGPFNETKTLSIFEPPIQIIPLSGTRYHTRSAYRGVARTALTLDLISA